MIGTDRRQSEFAFSGTLTRRQWFLLAAIVKTFTKARQELGLQSGEKLAFYDQFTPDEHLLGKQVIDTWASKLPKR